MFPPLHLWRARQRLSGASLHYLADRGLVARRLATSPLLIAGVLFALAGPSRADYADDLIQQAHLKHLAKERYWRLLLQDHRSWYGRYQSDIDDPKFFLSPRGRRDPSAELDATLQAFFEPPPRDPEAQSPQCRFPARYAWLKGQLHFDPVQLPEQSCPRFEQWRDSLNAESVAMGFASFYMNNPSTMYGHTFLLLKGKGHGPDQRLLDYVVNYAADTTSNNGVLFAVLGLAGGYRGRFSSMPYYVKVQQYSNLELRDLWEYDLALDSQAVDRMIRHLWELGNTSEAYFFLNKNCAYQLLPLLETADPRLHLSNHFHLKAIPMDTIRVLLSQPGLVKNIRYRPSHVSKMLAARSHLSANEVREAEKLARNDPAADTTLARYPVPRRAKILDSAYDLFRYRTGFERDQPPAVQQQERRLLLARNQLGFVENEESEQNEQGNPIPISPDHGHKTGRVGLGYGFTNHSHFEELAIRPAAHDQDDPPTGYIPGSQLQMFNLRLRYDDDRKTAYLQEFSLVDLKSFSPWDPWAHHPSWQVHTGMDVANDLNRDPENSLYYGLNAGSGISFKTPLSPDSLVYALAGVDSGVGHPFQDGYRLGGGGSSGLMFDIANFWHVHFNATYYDYIGNPMSSTRLQLVQGCPLTHDTAIRVTLQRQNTYKEILMSLLIYL